MSVLAIRHWGDDQTLIGKVTAPDRDLVAVSSDRRQWTSVCVCARVCVRARVCVCARATGRARARVVSLSTHTLAVRFVERIEGWFRYRKTVTRCRRWRSAHERPTLQKLNKRAPPLKDK